MEKKYRLIYLEKFYDDLTEIMDYIAFSLENPKAAHDLVNRVEAAIVERLDYPEAFQLYPTRRKRKNPYYRIYVDSYVVYYVVKDDVMEVRRILYGKRDADRYSGCEQRRHSFYEYKNRDRRSFERICKAVPGRDRTGSCDRLPGRRCRCERTAQKLLCGR